MEDIDPSIYMRLCTDLLPQLSKNLRELLNRLNEIISQHHLLEVLLIRKESNALVLQLDPGSRIYVSAQDKVAATVIHRYVFPHLPNADKLEPIQCVPVCHGQQILETLPSYVESPISSSSSGKASVYMNRSI
jgi:hypothetical protein